MIKNHIHDSVIIFLFCRCRKTQQVYDQCVKDNMNLERPPYGYFCLPKVHNTTRPKPPPPEIQVFDNLPAKLPEDEPKPKPKYGSRFPTLID